MPLGQTSFKYSPPTPVIIRHYSTPIFIDTLLSPEWQTGEAWEPSAILFRTSESSGYNVLSLVQVFKGSDTKPWRTELDRKCSTTDFDWNRKSILSGTGLISQYEAKLNSSEDFLTRTFNRIHQRDLSSFEGEIPVRTDSKDLPRYKLTSSISCIVYRKKGTKLTQTETFQVVDIPHQEHTWTRLHVQV